MTLGIENKERADTHPSGCCTARQMGKQFDCISHFTRDGDIKLAMRKRRLTTFPERASSGDVTWRVEWEQMPAEEQR